MADETRYQQNLKRAANSAFSAKLILSDLGVEVSGQEKFYCPMHDDNNKMSACYYPESNEIYCFAERRTYRPYDLLSEGLDFSDAQIVRALPEKLQEKIQIGNVEQEDKETAVSEVMVNDLKSAHKEFMKGEVGLGELADKAAGVLVAGSHRLSFAEGS